MSKKIKLKLEPEELKAFNQVWDVHMPPPKKPLDRMVVLIVKEVATKFVKKSIGQEKATSISLLEFEAIALKIYLQWNMVRLDELPNCGAFEQNLINRQYLLLDQKTV